MGRLTTIVDAEAAAVTPSYRVERSAYRTPLFVKKEGKKLLNLSLCVMEVPNANPEPANVEDGIVDQLFDPHNAHWVPPLRRALDRGATVGEIRTVILQLMPTRLHNNVRVGSWVLREVLRHSQRPPTTQRAGGRRNGYPTLPILKFLVEEMEWGPAILMEKDPDGYIALHVALIEHSPPTLIKYLVKKAPDAVRVRASGRLEHGFYPIHLAVDRDQRGDHVIHHPRFDEFEMHPWEVVHCLLEAWPESINVTSYRGWTVLHHALRHLHQNRAQDRNVVRRLINWWPESLSWQTEDGCRQLALHVAISESAPLSDLQHLVQAYPKAIRVRTRSGYLPLHLALIQPGGEARPAGPSSPFIIQFLIEQYSSALRKRTGFGLLPLHLAFATEDGEVSRHAPRLSLVKLLVEASPESVRDANNEENHGWIALSYAVLNPQTPPEVLQYLVSSYPESVLYREPHGYRRVALHLAAQSDLSVASIDALIRAGPQALQMRTKGYRDCDGLDDDEYLPLHYLIKFSRYRHRWRQNPQHGSLLDAVQCFVRHDPASVRQKTRRDGKLPLHLALEEGESTQDDDSVVEYLLEEWPDSVRVATMDQGWLAIHCAAHKGRAPWVLRSLTELWPNSVRQVSRDDDKQLLPIHVAAKSAGFSTTPESTVQFFLDEWPDSALERSGEGLLPIHYAATALEGTADMIHCLLRHRPVMVGSVTTNGHSYCPLHLAALRRFQFGTFRLEEHRAKKLQAIKCLVEEDPAMLLAESADTSNPLHLALQSDGLDENVVKYLIDQCAESVRRRDIRGRLPLHVLVGQKECHDLSHLRGAVIALVESYPESPEVADAQGFLPLHAAAECDHASLDVVYMLLRRRPETIPPGTARVGGDSTGFGRRRRPQADHRSRRTTASKRLRSDEPP